MKLWILPLAVFGAVAITACERTVVTPPNAAVVTPAPSPSTTVVTPPSVVAVPGPKGEPGAPGAPGAPGKSETVVVTPPASDAPKSN